MYNLRKAFTICAQVCPCIRWYRSPARGNFNSYPWFGSTWINGKTSMSGHIGIYADVVKVNNLTVIFIISAPNPRLLHLSGVPHIYFPPYSKEQSIQILSLEP